MPAAQGASRIGHGVGGDLVAMLGALPHSRSCGPYLPGRVPDPPGADPAGDARAQATSGALRAEIAVRAYLLPKLMRRVPHAVLISARTWPLRNAITLQDSHRSCRSHRERRHGSLQRKAGR